MLNHQRIKNIIEAKRTKQQIVRLTNIVEQQEGMYRCHEGGNVHGWYQARKRATQRLRSLSGGRLTLVEDGYRGHQSRHWLQDSECEHVFRASLKEVFTIGPDKICPFCNIPEDVSRCGTVAAVQQNVESLSYSNINFIFENELRGPDDLYEFACLVHGVRFKGTYRKFLQDPVNFCNFCAFDNGKT